MTDIYLEIDVDRAIQQLTGPQFRNILAKYLQAGIVEAMDIIGQTAVSDFMRLGQVEWRNKGGPVVARTQRRYLNIMTSRLSRSILGVPYQGQWEYIRDVKKRRNEVIGIMGSRVPYAAVHEFGIRFVHRNLYGRGIRAVINIPPRPYLKPAMQKSRKKVERAIRRRLVIGLEKMGLK